MGTIGSRVSQTGWASGTLRMHGDCKASASPKGKNGTFLLVEEHPSQAPPLVGVTWR